MLELIEVKRGKKNLFGENFDLQERFFSANILTSGRKYYVLGAKHFTAANTFCTSISYHEILFHLIIFPREGP